MSAAQPFWIAKKLEEMSHEEWESLCDGCGLCCLHKLEDEETAEVFYTDVACRLLDHKSCQCQNYAQRKDLVPDCLTLTYPQLHDVTWLPSGCAYRLLAEGKKLFDWHPLVSGNPNSVHEAKVSVKDRCVSEDAVPEEELEERIIYWVE